MLLGILSALLVFSLIMNVVAYRYARHLINKLQQFTNNIEELRGLLDVYSQHLQQTHDAPTFYGDSTLQNLLKHTKEIMNDIKDFNDSFLIEQPSDQEER